MSPDADAWHEAGHALAAHLLGGDVREVTLESERDGATGHATVAWRADDGPAHALRLATVALAGPVAERLFEGADVVDDPAALASWRGDWDCAEEQLRRVHAAPAARDAARAALVGELMAFFDEPETYESLARIADALDAHRTLDALLFREALEGR